MLGTPIPLKRTNMGDSEKQAVDITIDVISLVGLHIHESGAKRPNDLTVAACIFPSNTRPITSLSLPVRVAPKTKSAGLVQWSTQGGNFPSIKFRQHLSENSFLTKCSIDLVISRNGIPHPLGTTTLVINCEDTEKKNLHVAVDRLYPQKKMFSLQTSGLPMFRPEEETYKYGLAADASMHMSVQVTEASGASVLGEGGSRSVFSFDTDEESDDSLYTKELSMLRTNYDDISVRTLTISDIEPIGVTREISGLTTYSYWYDSLFVGTDKSSASGSGSTGETVETILSTDSESDWLSLMDNISLPSQIGVEVVPYEPPSPKLSVTFGAVDEFTFIPETSTKVLVTLPSKSEAAVVNIQDDKKDDIANDATRNQTKQEARVWARSLKRWIS